MNNELAYMGMFGIVSFTVALWALAELWETRQKLKQARRERNQAIIDRDQMAERLTDANLQCAANEETIQLLNDAYVQERINKNRLGRMFADAMGGVWRDDEDVKDRISIRVINNHQQ